MSSTAALGWRARSRVVSWAAARPAAADREEVVGGAAHGDAEDLAPLLGEPGLGAVELFLRPVGPQALQRPGQRGAVDLAGRPGRQVPDRGEQRDEGGRQRGAQLFDGARVVPAVLGDDIADEELVAAAGGADGGRGAGDAGQGLQGRVHLTQLDPAAAELDLLVGPPEEDQPFGFGLDQVTAPVGALPAERLQRRVLLRVLLGVEIPGETDPADHQLAAVAQGDRLAGLVDDGELTAVEGQADTDRLLAGHEGGAGDDGGLGGSVGVPHLAALGHQTLHQLGRAGLTAEDQQPDLVEGLRLPEGGQGGHGGDDGDLLLDQPGPQVGAAADLGARHRHQAGAVAPGQPHLLAGGVEGDGEARRDPVAGSDRVLGEEEVGLRVDEGGGAAVAHGHALGPAGGAGGEDDPRVVIDAGPPRGNLGDAVDGQSVPGPHDRPYPGFAEDQLGALVGVLGVHRHIGRAGRQYGEDGDVEIVGARGHADADAVAEAHPGVAQPRAQGLDLDGQGAAGEAAVSVVEGGLVGVRPAGGVEDVDQGAGRGGGGGGEARRVAELRAHLLVEQCESGALLEGCHQVLTSCSRSVRGAGGPAGMPGDIPVQLQTSVEF